MIKENNSQINEISMKQSAAEFDRQNKMSRYSNNTERGKTSSRSLNSYRKGF